jgi:uncharacterized protein (TIGR02453 family)
VWPPEALEFLRELEQNNDRDWFRANRKRYDEHLRRPTEQLAEQLSYLGQPRLFRPYRDTRFRPGPPLKEQVAVSLGHESTGGFYVSLSLDGLFVGAGLHHPAADQLERFRAAIDDGRRAKGFERAMAKAHAAGLDPVPPALKRAPKGYSPDHPRIDRLRMRELTVYDHHKPGPWLHTPEADQRVKAQLNAARPLVRWLAEAVGPSTRAGPR